jgi:hypothetical protein
MANIDNYLATITGDKRAALDELRRTIRSIVPRAEECISYGMPAFRLDGRVIATDHLEQTERSIDAIEKLLPGCQLVHLCDREFDDLQLLRHLAERPYVIRCKHLSRLVTVHGEEQSLRHCADRVKLRQAGEVVRRLEHSTQTYTLFIGQTVVTMKGKSLRGVARNKNQPKGGKALRVRVVVSELRQPGQRLTTAPAACVSSPRSTRQRLWRAVSQCTRAM